MPSATEDAVSPQPLRVAQVVRRFAFEEWGGTENVVWSTSRALRPLGVESEIVATAACSWPGHEVRDGVSIRRFRYIYPYFPLVAAKRLALDKKGGNPLSLPLYRHLRIGHYDLYHVHTLGRMAQMASQAARSNGRPYVMSFHGGLTDVPVEELRQMARPLAGTLRWGGLVDRALGWRVDPVRDAAGLICVGANELPALQERYPGKRVLYLPNGVDAESLRQPSGLILRRHLAIPEGRQILLCVSRIDYQKNQKLLLSLAARCRSSGQDVQVLLIGPVTVPSYYDELKAQAAELGVADFLTVVPGVEPGGELLRAAYQQSDVFLLPSLHEPFGIVVLEAWSCGLPVIAARVGGLQHLVRDGDNGLLCDPRQPDEWLAALAALRESPRREALVRNAARAVQDYSWSLISARLQEFYQEVLRG